MYQEYVHCLLELERVEQARDVAQQALQTFKNDEPLMMAYMEALFLCGQMDLSHSLSDQVIDLLTTKVRHD